MRIRGLMMLAAAVGFLSSPTADADLLNFTATFTIEIGEDFPSIPLSASGYLNADILVASDVVGFTVPSGAFGVTDLQILVPDPEELIPDSGLGILTLTVDAENQLGSFGGPTGLMPIMGNTLILIGGVEPPDRPGFLTGMLPLTGAFGAPGSVMGTILLPVTVSGTGFSTGTVSAISQGIGEESMVVTRMGGVETYLTLDGTVVSDLLLGVNKHTVFTYVSPTQIVIPGFGGPPTAQLAAFGTLVIDIVQTPEPGILLLLGSGLLGLALIGRKPRQKVQ